MSLFSSAGRWIQKGYSFIKGIPRFETLVSKIISQPQKEAVLIANPASGSYAQYAHQLQETIKYLNNNSWQVDLKLTQHQGDAGQFAREAVEQKKHVVISVGGDGTINEIIQALAGTETALGVLPMGTVNIWAREMGIPLDAIGAADVLIHGDIRPVDLGRMNDRYFLLMAGIGFDGDVTRTVEKKTLKKFGVPGYLLVGTWIGLGYKGFRTTIKFGDQVIRTHALQIVIGNTQLYGGAIKFTWKAKCDDGILDICVIRRWSPFERVLLFIDFLLKREQRTQWVRYETSDHIEITTSRPVAVQVDGDPAGNTPVVFKVAPKALKVIVPHKDLEEVFSDNGSVLES